MSKQSWHLQHRILQHWVTSNQLCENDQFSPGVAYESVAYKKSCKLLTTLFSKIKKLKVCWNIEIIALVKIFIKNCKNKLLNRKYMK